MFTGIVTRLGLVEAVEKRRGGARIVIRPSPAASYRAGESVCVSGVCLTAIRNGRRLVADVSSETLRRSTLGAAGPGARVNLERALRWGDRLSGHFVMGHVDGVARVVAVVRAGNSWTFRFTVPRGMGRFVARKGSVALDGVSLTVAGKAGRGFSVAVIPETWRRTTLSAARPGDRVNFEADIFARYGRRGSAARIRAREKK